MPFKKGMTKGFIASISGVIGHYSGFIPELALGGEWGAFTGFIIGSFAGLLVGDALAGDLTTSGSLAFVRGLGAAGGGAVGAIWLPGFTIINFVIGTFTGTVISDIVTAPFSASD